MEIEAISAWKHPCRKSCTTPIMATADLARFIFNVDPKDQLRLVGSLRRDFYQMPIDPADIANGVIQLDGQHESDGYLNFSWVRTLRHDGLLTVSPFYHFNSANYDSSPLDFPNAITDHRASSYVGAQTTLSATMARNTIQGGLYGFWQHDDQLFGVLFNDGQIRHLGSADPHRKRGSGIRGRQVCSDSVADVSGGVRQTHFSSPTFSENPTSPRAGVSVRIPRLNWVFRGFYGQFYQPPPLVTVSGPLLAIVNTPKIPKTRSNLSHCTESETQSISSA